MPDVWSVLRIGGLFTGGVKCLPKSGYPRIRATSLFSIEPALWNWLLSPPGLPGDQRLTDPLWQLVGTLSY